MAPGPKSVGATGDPIPKDYFSNMEFSTKPIPGKILPGTVSPNLTPTEKRGLEISVTVTIVGMVVFCVLWGFVTVVYF